MKRCDGEAGICGAGPLAGKLALAPVVSEIISGGVADSGTQRPADYVGGGNFWTLGGI
jgi:hypothetical protein